PATAPNPITSPAESPVTLPCAASSSTPTDAPPAPPTPAPTPAAAAAFALSLSSSVIFCKSPVTPFYQIAKYFALATCFIFATYPLLPTFADTDLLAAHDESGEAARAGPPMKATRERRTASRCDSRHHANLLFRMKVSRFAVGCRRRAGS